MQRIGKKHAENKGANPGIDVTWIADWLKDCNWTKADFIESINGHRSARTVYAWMAGKSGATGTKQELWDKIGPRIRTKVSDEQAEHFRSLLFDSRPLIKGPPGNEIAPNQSGEASQLTHEETKPVEQNSAQDAWSLADFSILVESAENELIQVLTLARTRQNLKEFIQKYKDPRRNLSGAYSWQVEIRNNCEETLSNGRVSLESGSLNALRKSETLDQMEKCALGLQAILEQESRFRELLARLDLVGQQAHEALERANGESAKLLGITLND